jgi:protein-tyrosine phosphatase
MMRAFYSRTDHLGKKYKPVFDQLLTLQDDHALMFHCTAGKDRTGVGAALILYSLGVDEAVIYQDYEATNEYRKAYNEMAVKGMVAQGFPEKAAVSMMAAKKEYLQTALDAIRKQYGSIDSFLEKEMGLTADKRSLLKKKFLY